MHHVSSCIMYLFCGMYNVLKRNINQTNLKTQLSKRLKYTAMNESFQLLIEKRRNYVAGIPVAN